MFRKIAPLLLLPLFWTEFTDAFVTNPTVLPSSCHLSSSCLSLSSSSISPQEALKRTAAHLEKLKRQQQKLVNNDNSNNNNNNNDNNNSSPPDPLGEERERLCREYLQQAANSLKIELKGRQLETKGRKPDLAMRLAEDDLQRLYGNEITYKEEVDKHDVLLNDDDDDDNDEDDDSTTWSSTDKSPPIIVSKFAGLTLSDAASQALTRAQFQHPSPIQAAAIPALHYRRESCILHAETGSGKSLAYVLPITEQLWKDTYSNNNNNNDLAVIVTPTRELAAQVAGIATVLAPPGTVRFVSRPCNVFSDNVKERGESKNGGLIADADDSNGRAGVSPRLFIGSAKAIQQSLYGSSKLPAPPTPKPEAMRFLRNVRWIVLDEVDRLLGVAKTRGEKKLTQSSKRHEKPAAILCAAVTRLTVGKAQIVAASATVGRPLKRELARVLGLPPQECPPVIQANSGLTPDNAEQPTSSSSSTTTRAVSIPDTVQNYIVPVTDGSSPGKILTTAYQVIREISASSTSQQQQPKKILLVLTRNFGINTQNAIGALKHFKCEPEPKSLLDALEADGSDNIIEAHRQVSGAKGVGESENSKQQQQQQQQPSSSYFDDSNNSSSKNDKGYLLVTGEDTVRGLHLDGLDIVIIAGRPYGPDEYLHIAGRTGRAGRTGKAINIVGEEQVPSLLSWERMLHTKFVQLLPNRVADVQRIILNE